MLVLFILDLTRHFNVYSSPETGGLLVCWLPTIEDVIVPVKDKNKSISCCHCTIVPCKPYASVDCDRYGQTHYDLSSAHFFKLCKLVHFFVINGKLKSGH